MRIFKYKWFSKFVQKENIEDGELLDIIDKLEAGQADADLGSGVFKMRMARPGGGKSGSFRVIVFFRSEDKAFFQYAYPKAARDNISEKELRFFKKLAKKYLAMTESQLTEALNAEDFFEIVEDKRGEEVRE